MNKKPKNIEQLYSESFNDFRVEPSSGLWKKISTKLAWRNFFSFNPTAINAYYVAGLLTIVTAGALWIAKPVSDDNQIINETTINNERPKAEGERQKEEDSIKTKVKSKKIKVKNEDQLNEKEMKPVPTSPLSTEVSSTAEASLRAEASAKAVTKADTQKLSSSAIVTAKADSSAEALAKAENQESIPGIKHISPSTQNPEPSTHELATPHPKPKTPNPPSTQYQAPSTDLPDPWPNIDSLFTNNTTTTPQHSIQFPNAFTPNSNGPTNGYYTPGLPNNDVFHPVYKGVVEYHLSIFNRRGELIFESDEINVGWDGYINDRLSAQGVYIWKARGIYSNGENFIKAGNIMLIIK